MITNIRHKQGPVSRWAHMLIGIIINDTKQMGGWHHCVNNVWLHTIQFTWTANHYSVKNDWTIYLSIIHHKTEADMMPRLSSLGTPQVIVVTSCGDVSDDNVAMMVTLFRVVPVATTSRSTAKYHRPFVYTAKLKQMNNEIGSQLLTIKDPIL